MTHGTMGTRHIENEIDHSKPLNSEQDGGIVSLPLRLSKNEFTLDLRETLPFFHNLLSSRKAPALSY